MGRPKKVDVETITNSEENVLPTIHDIEWTDNVLSFLTDDEKIMGNPTTDGLRRIFEKVMDCQIIASESTVVQSPSRENEMRATVQFTLIFKTNESDSPFLDNRSVTGCADVYWGNCDKVFRNHPVAVAETRAEGRALRRALRLRKVVVAEEIATEIEDDITGDSVGKITSTQVNFIDVMARRIDINMKKMLESININLENIYELTHDQAIDIIRKLSTYQQSVASIPDSIKIYEENWK